MAEKEKPAKKKKKLHKIITTRAQDGSFGHEHMYEGESQPVFAGTSKTLDDVHQHHDDHFGGGEQGGGQAEEQAEAAQEQGEGE
jgi:hypothetical protein